MRTTARSRFGWVLAAALCGPAAAPADVIKVDLSAYANARIQTYQPSSAGYPEGSVTLGGVPFDIFAVGGNNAWNAQNVPGPRPHVLSIPLSVFGATDAHTLINTFYGQPGPASYVALEFFGTGGAYHRKELIGNVDVRDHFFSNWTNAVNGTSAVTVYSSGGGRGSESRLDMQEVPLPAAFLGATLTEFRLTSTGGVGISDASIQGLTFRTAVRPAADVAAVPEPSGLAVAAVAAGWAAFRRRRRDEVRPA